MAGWTVLTLVRTTSEYFQKRGVPAPRLSAEYLLAEVLGCRRLDLYLDFDRPLSASEIDAYREHVRRRSAHEPIEYITGKAGFRDLELAVDPRVLIPRPETEQLVDEVLDWARAESRHGRAPSGGWRLIDVARCDRRCAWKRRAKQHPADAMDCGGWISRARLRTSLGCDSREPTIPCR
jgi:release factor glutamine methyltransferase